ncbi:hypothetical protein Mgra_00001430 [Meloidogyne graminicola]|uniref:Uncharacterized protein n=1 Tax=Meloidogyne graminicola TaxID=189291 RepID=A0A8T0A1L8_9BILA|nr:hypothetical protein Mgra_00001430 [Meloidogyne graminicola]
MFKISYFSFYLFMASIHSPDSSDSFNKSQTTITKVSLLHESVFPSDSFEALENEFDKTFVDLDVLLGEFEHENKELETSNDKLIGALATNSLLEEQSEQLLLRVHSLQCQLYSKTAPHESEIIKKKLDKEMRMFQSKNLPIAKTQAEIPLLKEENLRLRSLLNAVHGEIYGARLAAKYLDKELAGRVPDVRNFLRRQNDLVHQKQPTTSGASSTLMNNNLSKYPTLSPCSPSSSLSMTSTCNSLCDQQLEEHLNNTSNNFCSQSCASSASYESATDECSNSIKLRIRESLYGKLALDDNNIYKANNDNNQKNNGNPFL